MKKNKNYYKIVFCVLAVFASLRCHAIPGYYEPWGKHADLKIPTEKTSPQPPKLSLMGKFAEMMILFHQRVLTQADGPRSHFRPTSSRYMLLAIRRHGFLKGFMMGCDRLLRENEDAWVYRTVEIDGQVFKHDPIPQ